MPYVKEISNALESVQFSYYVLIEKKRRKFSDIKSRPVKSIISVLVLRILTTVVVNKDEWLKPERIVKRFQCR